jgi:hypothetical protein
MQAFFNAIEGQFIVSPMFKIYIFFAIPITVAVFCVYVTWNQWTELKRLWCQRGDVWKYMNAKKWRRQNQVGSSFTSSDLTDSRSYQLTSLKTSTLSASGVHQNQMSSAPRSGLSMSA